MPPQTEDETTSLLTTLSSRKEKNSRSGGRCSSCSIWHVVWGLMGVAVGMVLMHHHAASKTTSSSSNMRQHPATTNKSPYKQVQGMGFQIYTGGAPAFLNDKQKKNPECMGRASYGQVVGEEAPEIQCYIGHDDPLQDVSSRLQIMEAAVERAYEIADKDKATLKVFVAPEFYWRGVDGAYVFEEEGTTDCGAICHILQGLERLVSQKRFEDWLFVFGTVIASEVLPQEDPYDMEFYNFAPVYKGYDPSSTSSTKEGKRFLVPKRYVSSSDFLTPQRHLNASLFRELIDEELPEHDTTVFNPHDFERHRYDNKMWKEYKQELNDLGYTMIEYDWLIMDDISFTIEICFDHDRRSALNTYLADMVTGKTTRIPSSTRDGGLAQVPIPDAQAQISIVSSAGMQVTEDSLVLRHSGTIFLQDGLSNDTNRMYWSSDECDAGLQFEGGTEAVQRRAVLSATDVFFDHVVLDTFQRHHVFHDKTWEEAISGTFSAKMYPPKITIYDAVDIAGTGGSN